MQMYSSLYTRNCTVLYSSFFSEKNKMLKLMLMLATCVTLALAPQEHIATYSHTRCSIPVLTAFPLAL